MFQQCLDGPAVQRRTGCTNTARDDEVMAEQSHRFGDGASEAVAHGCEFERIERTGQHQRKHVAAKARETVLFYVALRDRADNRIGCSDQPFTSLRRALRRQPPIPAYR